MRTNRISILKNAIVVLTIATIILVSGIITIKVSALENPNVKTLEAEFTEDGLKVNGTTESGVLAVTILVYDEKGENLITMMSTDVNAADEYNGVVDVDSGKYIVKAANYDGGDAIELAVAPGEKAKAKTNTGDENGNSMAILLAVLTLALAGTGTTIAIKKRNR